MHWLDRYYTLGAVNEAARAKTPGALYAQIEWWNKNLQAAGFPSGLLRTYIIAQLMLESDWMTSNAANTDNNYSGIKWINKPYQDATKGITAADGGHYAHFSSIDKFLKDYKRILSLKGSAGRPIDAQTASQFGDALRANHYFTDPNYHLKFNAALRKVTNAIKYNTGQEQKFLDKYNAGERTYTYTPGEGQTSNLAFNAGRNANNLQHWIEEHPTLAVAGGLGILFTVAYLSKD